MQTLIFSHDERINLEHAHIFGQEAIIKRATQLIRLFGEVALQVERFGQSPAVMRHEACGRVNVEIDDFFRCVMGHRFDIHTALG